MSGRVASLRHRLRLEAPAVAPDGGGGGDVSWSAVATVWASLRSISAGEIEDGDGVTGRVTHEIMLRNRPGVTTAMRFVAGARVFALRSVMDPDETGIWLRCLAEEMQA